MLSFDHFLQLVSLLDEVVRHSRASRSRTRGCDHSGTAQPQPLTG